MNKKTLVLLATCNGIKWLPTQVDSILNQEGSDITILVSDDTSTDGTWEWLQDLSIKKPNVQLLPHGNRHGSAAKNFYHLLKNANISDYSYIAFSDQDDIWLSNKIQDSIKLINNKNVDVISSNIQAFWPDGRRRFIIKSQQQKHFDYMFSSAGPGCTYLFTASLAKDIIYLLNDNTCCAGDVALHDWLVYAVCRLLGRNCFINPNITLLYRQHDSNEFGSNNGIKAAFDRHQRIASGWYRAEVYKIAEIAIKLGVSSGPLMNVINLLQEDTFQNRLKLTLMSKEFRRSKADQLILAGYFATGLFWSNKK